MTIQNIDFGTAASNDGETLDTAFAKIQANFEALFNGIGTVQKDTIASNATCDLSLKTAQLLNITGTTTITSFGTTANCLKFIYFTSACPITYNATSMITPYGVSFTTAAGACAIVASDGSGNWRWLAYLPGAATGTGSAVLATSPTFVTPALGTPASGTLSNCNIKSTSASSGIGYATGAGGAVTQATSRTTGVTLNTVCGAITLVSAAGSATAASFTVTNSSVAATDNVVVNQKSGTDKYHTLVTNIAAGSFVITFFTTGGTTTEQPVFNFSVIKAVAA